MKRLLTATVLSLALASPAFAQLQADHNERSHAVQLFQATYQLLGARAGSGFATTNGTGAPQGPIFGATYIYRVEGTFSGCTANLQVLDADGVSWLTVQTDTAAGTHAVTIGASPSASYTPKRARTAHRLHLRAEPVG